MFDTSEATATRTSFTTSAAQSTSQPRQRVRDRRQAQQRDRYNLSSLCKYLQLDKQLVKQVIINVKGMEKSILTLK